MLKITVLGSGTSSGVPTIACKCNTCNSHHKKDKRTRSSIMIENKTTRVIIDTSADFRYQMLHNKVISIDGVVFTHHHMDHIGGFDDLRAFNNKNTIVNIYSNQTTFDHLSRVFEYAFKRVDQLGGGIPLVQNHLISNDKFLVKDLEFEPIPIIHGKLDILGYRINNFAYLTDASFIPENSIKKLMNLDVLIINALRFHPHNTHFNVEEAMGIIDILKPKKAYFTHIAHDIKHRKVEKILPKNVRIAYDGMIIEC